MLIEFSVENFRSFREKQTLSMTAAPRLHKRENTFPPEINKEKLPPLLKVAAIYGPNASGKSNLIKALNQLQLIARRKPANNIVMLDVSPFRFDPMLLDEPSKFEVHFITKKTRYQFELSATADRITHERLYAFPNGHEKLLYSRKFIDNKEEYTFGETLEGGSDVHEIWRKLTGPRVLFISQAVANSSEELTQLKLPFNWLHDGLSIVSSVTMLGQLANATQRFAQKNTAITNDISQFLRDNDIPVRNIHFVDSENLPDTRPEELESSTLFDTPKKKMILSHFSKIGTADFNFNEESDGTKNLIGFWLPWSLHALHQYSQCMIVDELDSSLHPKIVAKLIESHINSDQVTQLIFTTHDTHLMDAKLLRRDQFWITERDDNGATQLRSIHDFDGREGEDIEKRYFEGRYRGLPIIKGL